MKTSKENQNVVDRENNVKEQSPLPMPELLTIDLPLKRLEEDICWIVSHVPQTTQSVKGLNCVDWSELKRHVGGGHVGAAFFLSFFLSFFALFQFYLVLFEEKASDCW